MTHLFLIRHGETDWNVEGRYQGQADPPLNARGRQQVQALAESLEPLRLDILYTSPLLRALETAQILSARLQIPYVSDARLIEIHQGHWQTRLRSEIQSLYPELFKRWEEDPWQVTPPQGESLMQVQARAHSALDEILARHPGCRVGIVSHRIPIALIKLRYQAGMDANIVRKLELPNAHWEEIIIGEHVMREMRSEKP